MLGGTAQIARTNTHQRAPDPSFLAPVLPGGEPDRLARAAPFPESQTPLVHIDERRRLCLPVLGFVQLGLDAAHEGHLAAAPIAVHADSQGRAGVLGGDNAGKGIGVTLELEIGYLAPAHRLVVEDERRDELLSLSAAIAFLPIRAIAFGFKLFLGCHSDGA